MKYGLIVVALLVSSVALGEVKDIGPAGATTQAANHASDNEPSNVSKSSGDGIALTGVCGVRVLLSAASGQTLSGAGNLKFWYLDTTLATPRWFLNPEADIEVSTSGRRDLVFKDRKVLLGYGRVYVEADTVTASGGALTVRLQTIACE